MLAIVYKTSVTEYLVSEVCERGPAARRGLRMTMMAKNDIIIPEGDCYAASMDDAELNELTKHMLKK